MTVVTAGRYEFRWTEVSFGSSSHPAGWAHHDVVAFDDGSVIVGRPEGSHLSVLNGADEMEPLLVDGLVEPHGMAPAGPSVDDGFWIADIGERALASRDYAFTVLQPARVVLYAPGHGIVRHLAQPTHPSYTSADWMPCAVAQMPGGDTWVADGYGQSLVHRYDQRGRHVRSLDGLESGRRFDTPHAIVLDTRPPEPELIIADRANSRLVALDLEGSFLRTFGSEHLAAPSGLAIYGDLLVVTDLGGAIVFLGRDGSLAGRIGQARGTAAPSGWPNAERDGKLMPPPLAVGIPNSPHGLAVDRSQNLWISEWLIGGRLVKLSPVLPAPTQ